MTTEATARENVAPVKFVRRFRLAAGLILTGLGVEALTLLSGHHLAFVAFLVAGGALIGAGAVVYLWSLVASG